MDGDLHSDELYQRARCGEPNALGELFCLYAAKLRLMLQLRLDRRIQGRVDVDDVLQEVYVEYARVLARHDAYQGMPFRLWLRMIATRRLQAIHRRHLGTGGRDVQKEISLYSGPLPEASSCSLAIQLLGKHTSPTQAAARAELQIRIQTALNEMNPLDREILALRHFEELSNSDVATLKGISPAAASNRFVRALRRIKELLDGALPADSPAPGASLVVETNRGASMNMAPNKILPNATASNEIPPPGPGG